MKAYADCLRATTGRPEDSIILVPKGYFRQSFFSFFFPEDAESFS
jgi:hypothetical protein